MTDEVIIQIFMYAKYITAEFICGKCEQRASLQDGEILRLDNLFLAIIQGTFLLRFFGCIKINCFS